MISMEGIASAWTNTRSTAVRRLLLDRQAEFWMGELDPVRSMDEIRARVVELVEETEDTKTFVLQPNTAWPGHRAGQYTSIEAGDVDAAHDARRGVRQRDRVHPLRAQRPAWRPAARRTRRDARGSGAARLHPRGRRAISTVTSTPSTWRRRCLSPTPSTCAGRLRSVDAAVRAHCAPTAHARELRPAADLHHARLNPPAAESRSPTAVSN